MKAKALILSILSVFILSSCAHEIVDFSGNIQGTVRDFNTGLLLENCNIALAPSGKSVSTDLNGEFSFTSLQPGNYTLTITKSGYENEVKDVTVIAGETTSVSVQLRTLSASTGSIKGVVKDYTYGRFISNCQITLNPSGTTYTTSDSGIYEFNGLNPGNYTLAFKKAGYLETTLNVTVKAGEYTQADCLMQPNAPFAVSESEYDYGDLADNKTFYLFNNSDGDISYSITNIPDWLSFDKTSGTVSAGSSESVTAIVDRSLVTEGSYTQTVTISYSGKDSGSTPLKISMSKVKMSAPTVVTSASATNVTLNSFDISGNITATGGSQVTEYGHCWSTDHNPTTSNSKTSLGMTNELLYYTSNVTGLTTNTTYYVRAYATNAYGTAYGEEVAVVTQDSECNVWDGNMAEAFTEGTGTIVDPIIIRTGAQLVLLKKSSDKYYKLANNIDLNNKPWPLINFSGNFDGNGCTIFNLKITRKEDNYLGLFAELTGKISNLTINGVNIDARSNKGAIGAFAGCLRGGDLEKCHLILNSESVIFGKEKVGGLVGYIPSSPSDKKIQNCSVTSTTSDYVINGSVDVGGLFGYIDSNLELQNCHVNANINGGNHTGGLFGSTDYLLEATSCSYTGNITGAKLVGGLCGNGSDGVAKKYYGCKVDATITATEDYAGGIQGEDDSYMYSNRSYCTGCYTTGKIICANDNSSYVTGFSHRGVAEFCYSTMISDHPNFYAFGYRNTITNCATVISKAGESEKSNEVSSKDITAFLKSCYSEHESYFNFNKTWTWSGNINGSVINVSCPRLSWE